MKSLNITHRLAALVSSACLMSLVVSASASASEPGLDVHAVRNSTRGEQVDGSNEVRTAGLFGLPMPQQWSGRPAVAQQPVSRPLGNGYMPTGYANPGCPNGNCGNRPMAAGPNAWNTPARPQFNAGWEPASARLPLNPLSSQYPLGPSNRRDIYHTGMANGQYAATPCANGQCSTGLCANGQCAGGQCRDCANGQCRNGNCVECRNGQCTTGNCPNGQCSVNGRLNGNCANGQCRPSGPLNAPRPAIGYNSNVPVNRSANPYHY
ncbi:MAG: hypothetical protein R3C20_25520 [Planctomycetaceae bacterium]